MRTQELIPIDGEKTIRNRKFKTFMQVDLIPNERIIQAVIGEKSPGGILRVNTGHKLGKEEDYQNARKKILGEILKLRTLDISAIQSERIRIPLQRYAAIVLLRIGDHPGRPIALSAEYAFW